MIPESEISECPEYKVKSKIGSIFVNEKILEEYSVTIYEIDPYFYEHYKKNTSWWKWAWTHIIQNWCLFFWISFSSRIDKKGFTDRDLIFEEKRQEALEKKLAVEYKYKHLLVSLKTDN